MEKFFRDLCAEKMDLVCRRIYPKFEKLGVKYPVLRYRKMKTCWGSCMPKKGTVTFNTALVHAPDECMEYVAVHEFCHFLQPNHSPAFYECMSIILPDWSIRKIMLSKCEFYLG